MNRTLSMIVTITAASASILVGTVAGAVSIDDAPGQAQQIAPLLVTPSAAASPAPPAAPATDGVVAVKPPAPRDVSLPTASHPEPTATPPDSPHDGPTDDSPDGAPDDRNDRGDKNDKGDSDTGSGQGDGRGEGRR